MNGWNDEDEEDEQFSTPIDDVDLRMFFYEVSVSLSIATNDDALPHAFVVLKRLPLGTVERDRCHVLKLERLAYAI